MEDEGIFDRYVKALKHLAETSNLGNSSDSLIRFATMDVLRREIEALADQISKEDRSANHSQALKKLRLAVNLFKDAALKGLDSDKTPKKRIRSIIENLDKFLIDVKE